MADLALTLGVGDYEHTRDLVSGDVRAEGIALTGVRTPIEELLYRFIRHREWEVSEMGLGPYASLLSRGHDGMVGLPVFTSRTFRHGALYVRTDADIRTPADLAGKRIGVPEWAMTAAIYTRALLAQGYGVDLRGIRWFQAGVNEPGRADKMNLSLPGWSITPMPHRSLSEMLLAGDLDAFVSARAPTPFAAGDPRIRRAFDDVFGAEQAWWASEQVFPIMHLIVLRRDAYEANRWIALNLFKAFEEAKRRALVRLADVNCSYLPLPWATHHVGIARDAMGDDPWPYGIEANRRTLEYFCAAAHDQNVCARRLSVEELFAPEFIGVSRT